MQAETSRCSYRTVHVEIEDVLMKKARTGFGSTKICPDFVLSYGFEAYAFAHKLSFRFVFLYYIMLHACGAHRQP